MPQPQSLAPRPRHVAVAVLALALAAAIGGLAFAPPALAQSATLTPSQSTAFATYDKALRAFRAILAERRQQIDAKQPLPNLPGQAVYHARLAVMSTYRT